MVEIPNMSNGKFFAREQLSLLPTRPSLTSAFDAQDVSAQVGFDFSDIDIVMQKVREEYNEVVEAFEQRGQDPDHFAEEIGDCFFALVNLSRHAGLDPEVLVKSNVRKYLERCQFIEDSLTSEGKQWSDLSPTEITERWKKAKQSGL